MSPIARPRRFDLVAFDWDGTLFDSTAIIVRSIQEAVRDVGGTVPSDVDAAYVIGMALNQALAHAAPDVPPEKYPDLNLRYRYHYARHQDDLSLFHGVLPLLGALREQFAPRALAGLPAMSLLEVTIKTGRTHQIRVHLSSQGHGIVGDDKYGDFDLNRRVQKHGLKRMFLHAWRLQFNHPASGERVELRAELPAELASFVA